MIILVLSDTHDRVDVVMRILEKEMGNVDAIFHAGDLVHVESLAMFEQVGVPVYYVLGNNEEGMEQEIVTRSKDLGIHVYSEVAMLSIGGRSLAMTHLPIIAHQLAASGRFDIVIFGHTHRQELVRKQPLFFNPGDVQGRHGDPSYAVLDTELMEVRFERIAPRSRSYRFDA